MTRDRQVGTSIGWEWPFACANCHCPYPADGFHYCCPTCGGVYDFEAALEYSPAQKVGTKRRGLARYRSAFPLSAEAALLSLGEGGTPLVEAPVGATTVAFKCEHLNPTGSFKDRGAAVLVSALAAEGVTEVVEDSSGNAGAALAAYAARAKIHTRIYVPESASGPKRAQMQAYGAEVVPVPGPRSAASEAVREASEAGAVYASHAHLPHVLAGTATVAFEVVEQMGDAPGSVVTPAGQGSLVLGMWHGFEAMRRAGVIKQAPQIVGVQARACAPLWAVHTAGAVGQSLVSEGPTVAEGIRILRPLRGDAVLAAVERSGGTWAAVEEDEIIAGRDSLARLGLYVEPTSAVVWPALLSLGGSLRPPVVAILTGSGFKAEPGQLG